MSVHNKGPLSIKNPFAEQLSDPKYRPKKVKPKKGKGSYSRKGPKYYASGGPLSLLRLGGDQADLAAANLARIKRQQDAAPVVTKARRGPDHSKWGETASSRKHKTWDAGAVDPAAVKRVADVATDFIPGVGEVKDVVRAGQNIAGGNYGAAALDAAAAVAGVVPGVGDAAAAGIRAAKGPLSGGVRNFHGFERASQRLPDLVPDQSTWNRINSAAQRGEGIEIGDITRRDRGGKGGSKDTRPGQEGRNAAVTIDGKQVPVVVVPHKDPDKKWHIITVRDRGHKGDQTGTLGGREYNEGGKVEKRSIWDYIWKNDNLKEGKGRWSKVKQEKGNAD